MTQPVYYCSYCPEVFDSGELILVDVINEDLEIEHKMVCWDCYQDLNEMGVLAEEQPVLLSV